jgi:AraC-like DNA-binding protein
MIYLVGIIITFFLALLLLGKKNKVLADKILFIWFLVIGVHLTLYYMAINQTIYDHSYLLPYGFLLPLLHGPIFLFYTAILTNQKKHLLFPFLHFLPHLLILLYLVDFIRLPDEAKINIFKNGGKGYELFMDVHAMLVMSSGVLYAFWVQCLLWKHKMNIKNVYSNTDRINLIWLQCITLGMALVWVFAFLNNDPFLFITVVFIVIFMGYFGITQVGILSTLQAILPDTKLLAKENIDIEINTQTEDTTSKYEKTGLSDVMALSISTKLHIIVQNQKPYTNPDLKLTDLASLLNVPPHHLSQVINTIEKKNFYDYINELRINHFLEYLKMGDIKKYTIMALAYQSGFNSKSSFNKYFKKITNLTPTEYIENLK